MTDAIQRIILTTDDKKKLTLLFTESSNIKKSPVNIDNSTTIVKSYFETLRVKNNDYTKIIMR